MHMLNVLANISDQNLAAQFLKTTNYNETKAIREYQKQVNSRYSNSSTPLADAQIAADNYMLMKQRKPMVIEYYKEKPTSNDKKFIESVEMYINPQRLSIQHQKVKGKAYTRGGIFYHHWGDDNPVMTLSGTVGYSMMKGIEQLERIYLNSGTLLKYGNMDLNKAGTSGMKTYQNIDFGNPSDIIDKCISNPNNTVINLALEGVDKKIEEASTISEKITYYNVKSMIKNVQNIMTQTQYQNAYREISGQIAEEANKMAVKKLDVLYQSAQKKINDHKLLKNLDSEIKIMMAFEISLPYLNNGEDKSDLSNLSAEQISTVINSNSGNYWWNSNDITSDLILKTYDIANAQAQTLNDYIVEVHEQNEDWKVDRETAFSGWADISDEIFDEYRPRLIFIYFEDRVYLGHFDSFSYNRSADTPLINYDMRFTIVRQIVVNQSSTIKDPSSSPMAKYFSTTSSSPVINAIEYYKNNKLEAYIQILYNTERITLNNSLVNTKINWGNDLKNEILTADEKENINNELSVLRPLALEWATANHANEINYYKNMINAKTFTWQQRLDIYALSKKYTKLKICISLECARISQVYNAEIATGKMTPERRIQIADWLKKIIDRSGMDTKWITELEFKIRNAV